MGTIPFLFVIWIVRFLNYFSSILMVTENRSPASVLTTSFILISSGAILITINTTLLGGEL